MVTTPDCVAGLVVECFDGGADYFWRERGVLQVVGPEGEVVSCHFDSGLWIGLK